MPKPFKLAAAIALGLGAAACTRLVDSYGSRGNDVLSPNFVRPTPPPIDPNPSKWNRAFGMSGNDVLRATYATRAVPPLDPNRKIAEQDCSKPLQTESANLVCR